MGEGEGAAEGEGEALLRSTTTLEVRLSRATAAYPSFESVQFDAQWDRVRLTREVRGVLSVILSFVV